MKRALTTMLLLFGMIAVANTGNNEEAKELLQAKKKAIYYEIRVDLMEGKISIEEAQKRWKRELSKLDKEGAQ
jgi:hypothetical protein